MAGSKRFYHCSPVTGVLSAILVAALVSGIAAAPVDRFDLPVTHGPRFNRHLLASARASVLIFVATDCPISNRYSPVLQQMEKQYGARGVLFFAVFSDGTATSANAAKHLTDFGLQMPGLLDATASLARQTGARVTPEAVLLAGDGAVLYRGRIDNRYVDWGKTRASATEHDLQEAIEATLAHRAVPHPVTKALGCAIAGVN